jgi:ketosteroid isomerase-like protein
MSHAVRCVLVVLRRSLLAVALAGCAGAGAGSAPVAAGSASVETDLARMKRELVNAYIERDAAALRRIYCDDFTVTSAGGKRRTKADELAGLADDGGGTLTSGTYEPIAFRSFGDVVVMHGHGELKGHGPKGPYEHVYDSFNVFVRRDGRWCYAAAFTP